MYESKCQIQLMPMLHAKQAHQWSGYKSDTYGTDFDLIAAKEREKPHPSTSAAPLASLSFSFRPDCKAGPTGFLIVRELASQQ